jgi:hypothetical protein
VAAERVNVAWAAAGAGDGRRPGAAPPGRGGSRPPPGRGLQRVPARRVRIGRERLRRVLHDNDVTFQRTRTWKESTDPDFEAQLDRIEHVSNAFPDRVFAFDQFGPLSIRPHHGAAWARPQVGAGRAWTGDRGRGIPHVQGA